MPEKHSFTLAAEVCFSLLGGWGGVKVGVKIHIYSKGQPSKCCHACTCYPYEISISLQEAKLKLK